MSKETKKKNEQVEDAKTDRLQTILSIVNGWRLNKVRLAFKMGMNPYTFKMKLGGESEQYQFTEYEINKLFQVLIELASDIERVREAAHIRPLANINLGTSGNYGQRSKTG